MRRIIVVTLFSVLLAGKYSLGQTSNGAIQGFVTDTSGAVVPNVAVVVTNQLTGAAQRAQSSSDGSYVVPGLLPGEYSIGATYQGFVRFVQTSVELQINQQLRVDIVLRPGSTKEVVNVSAAATQVETRTAALSQVVGNTEMIEMPLNARNTLALVGLDAGVTLMPTGGSDAGGGGSLLTNPADVYNQNDTPGVYMYNISGGRGNGVNYMIDGGTNMDPNDNVSMSAPSPDAIQEFSMQNTGYEAEFSGSGGTVNLITKSGTNALHGAAYDYLRNGDLNARNFFATGQDTLIRNQFGFAVGGPVLLPKLYDGRNHSFFFFNYEGIRENANSSADSVPTPTAAMRTGDLTSISTPVIDPTTGEQFDYQGVPNVIPPDRLDPAVQKLFAAYVGLPGPDGLFHYATSAVHNPTNQYTVRGDENLGEHDRIFGSYFRTLTFSGAEGTRGNIFDSPEDQTWETRHLTVSETHLFSSTIVNTALFAFARLQVNLIQSPANDSFLFSNFGVKLNVAPPITSNVQPESVFWTSYWIARVPSGAVGTYQGNDYDGSDNLSWVHGRHEFKFGGEVTHSDTFGQSDWLTDGRFQFGSSFTGNGWGDVLLGLPYQLLQNNPSTVSETRPFFGFYVQDKFQMSRRLSLTYGVRWQPFVNWKEVDGHLDYWSPGQQSTVYPGLPPGLVVPGDAGVPARGQKSEPERFGPRFGFAYDPFGNGKWAIRGGYGVFLEDTNWTSDDSPSSLPPFSFSQTVINPPSFSDPWAGRTDPFPAPIALPHNAVFTLPLGEIDFYDPHLRNPYSQNWNLTVEHQLRSNFLVRASYVGSKGTRLARTEDLNPAVYIPGNNAEGQPLSTLANEQSRFLYPNFTVLSMGTSDGSSTYHALQLSIERPFYRNLQVKANYTYSKCIDNGFQAFGPATGWNERDPFDPGLDRGRCDFDITNRFVTSFVGHPWDPKGGNFLLRHLLGNWVTTGIVTVQQGLPLTLFSGYDNSLTGVGMDTADQVGNPRAVSGIQDRRLEWFNTSAYVPNAIGTFGTSGRNVIGTPGLFNIDFGLYKDFPIGRREGTYVEFRSEYFNLLNHTNFGEPGNTLASSTFGEILSANPPRILQFALRINF